MLTAIYIFFLVFTFAIGTVVASFMNVVIYRLPLHLDFVHGRSFCPKCNHTLMALDLVPIFSYLLLGRKCRYCGDPISPRYMLVETLGGVLALVSYLAFLPPWGFLANAGVTGTLGFSWQNGLAALVYFLAMMVLICVTFIDADTQEIPNSLHIWLALCAVVAFFCVPQVGWLARVIGVFVISVPMLILTLIIPGAFGLGDVKLMAAAGLLLGWQNTILAAFIGVVIGGAYGIYLLASGKKGRKAHFAFGPALCAGITVALFAGTFIVRWYVGLL
jgi:leader peptidase (prepilin peptidase)/N-methyltransferase